MTSQSSPPNAIFATFANNNSAKYARDSVDAEDDDGDIQSVGNDLIDERFFVRELPEVKAKHDGVILFLFIGTYIECFEFEDSELTTELATNGGRVEIFDMRKKMQTKK